MDNNDIEFRKLEHLLVCNYCDVEYKKGTLLEDVELIHSGVSNCDLNDIDTSIELFNKKLGAPLIVAAITGGHSKAKEINKNIAIAVEELNLGMGVGSQRAGIVNDNLIDTYSVVRDYTSTLVIGNLGAVNFIEDNWNEEIIHKSVDMIDADAIAIHFNPLQEAIQPEGDVNFKGVDIGFVSQNTKEKISSLTDFQTRQLINHILNSNEIINYIIFDNKAVVYKITDSKFAQNLRVKDNFEMETLLQNIKNTTIITNLIKQLQNRYEIISNMRVN